MITGNGVIAIEESSTGNQPFASSATNQGARQIGFPSLPEEIQPPAVTSAAPSAPRRSNPTVVETTIDPLIAHIANSLPPTVPAFSIAPGYYPRFHCHDGSGIARSRALPRALRVFTHRDRHRDPRVQKHAANGIHSGKALAAC